MDLPILDLSAANDLTRKPELLRQLRRALFDIGFLYIINHGILPSTIDQLTDLLPSLFALPDEDKANLSKLNSPHFLGYSGYAEETTLGKQDLREQFDFATELPVVYSGSGGPTNGHLANGSSNGQDFSQLYWRLRGPNQWPNLAGFKEAFTTYHNAVQELAYRFVHLIEEAFEIPIGTFDHFFGFHQPHDSPMEGNRPDNNDLPTFLPPQHRINHLRYPPSPPNPDTDRSQVQPQGVGPHKDSSGWLTFLLQAGNNPGLEVLSPNNREWIPAPPIPGTFVVNFGNAFEAATEGAVRATTHRVIAPGPGRGDRYSIPFFQGLPLDMTVEEGRANCGSGYGVIGMLGS
ncbi:hypothetical protein LTR91_019082 [Friedmanniomyces endolithicus]|uniref:Fe2OG dioxygenase domain-containing protein n=1 Tax=Friedmanniomyces endolithicus TaxID=329885 RepID=A0AAN6K4D1_9PEZI|nr:hypothetical protein LTR57_019738 [Friedmanniomyces endolithicus]KAK0956568.1 hypothetical protein LTS01_022785 [Friedmanniomyces endolithicus]KAK0963217.1 hypothetical protein LTR91_019082 [Friedmanniomyces endolithicus]KAK1026861.1 hypothetical protein LTS16_021966 [Friedmanniomyces endolithicus]